MNTMRNDSQNTTFILEYIPTIGIVGVNAAINGNVKLSTSSTDCSHKLDRSQYQDRFQSLDLVSTHLFD